MQPTLSRKVATSSTLSLLAKLIVYVLMPMQREAPFRLFCLNGQIGIRQAAFKQLEFGSIIMRDVDCFFESRVREVKGGHERVHAVKYQNNNSWSFSIGMILGFIATRYIRRCQAPTRRALSCVPNRMFN